MLLSPAVRYIKQTGSGAPVRAIPIWDESFDNRYLAGRLLNHMVHASDIADPIHNGSIAPHVQASRSMWAWKRQKNGTRCRRTQRGDRTQM